MQLGLRPFFFFVLSSSTLSLRLLLLHLFFLLSFFILRFHYFRSSKLIGLLLRFCSIQLFVFIHILFINVSDWYLNAVTIIVSFFVCDLNERKMGEKMIFAISWKAVCLHNRVQWNSPKLNLFIFVAIGTSSAYMRCFGISKF